MRKLLSMALIAAVTAPLAVPATASAQHRDRYERRDDRRDFRDDRRDDRRDFRDDRRDDRRDYRDDRRDDRNHRWGDNDWRGWREHNRGYFARGNWNAPFRYNRFRPGVRIAPSYFGSRYWIADPWRYRLPPVFGAQRYVRHYDDLLLIDTRRGVVIRVIPGFFF